MFYHVKELEFNARVSGSDSRFASLLLEQFGGPNSELKAAMQYFMNMSNGTSVRGPWNQGQGSWEPGENWQYVENPHEHVVQTQGMVDHPVKGTKRTPEEAEQLGRELGRQRSQEIKSAIGGPSNQWSTYPQTPSTNPTQVENKAK